MNRMLAVTIGLCLATTAFAQDSRSIEYDSINTCTGGPIEHQVFTPKSRSDSRFLDSIQFNAELALEAIDECDSLLCEQPDHGGGPDNLLLTTCERLTLLFLKDREQTLETDVIVKFHASPIEIVCSHTEGGGGGSHCSGLPDNAASERAILIHNGFTEHDTNPFNGDNTQQQSP